MLIGEAAALCKLTKKAISYYEQQGLLEIKTHASGYRDFDEADVELLKEVYILRQLGISVAEIKGIVTSEDKHTALLDYKLKKEVQLRQVQAQYDCLNDMLDSGHSIAEAFREVEHKLDDHLQIRDKLLQAFPGSYGIYLGIHFGKFLEGRLDTREKITAYNEIVAFLDRVDDLEFPAELQQYMNDVFAARSKPDLEALDRSIDDALDHYKLFMAEHKDHLEWYIEYRTSEEFKASPAYRLQQSLLEFQNNSGYYDIFIANLQILSSSYRKYQDKLKLANERLLADYPQVSQFYP